MPRGTGLAFCYHYKPKQKTRLDPEHKKGEPGWTLEGSEKIEFQPAVQWKLLNIRKMPKQKQLETP